MTDVIAEYCKRSILLNDLQYYFSSLETEQLEKLHKSGNFRNSLEDLIQHHLKPKPEPINESQLINDFWELPRRTRFEILNDLLGWSEQKFRELETDFGWGISPIILRYLREARIITRLPTRNEKISNLILF